MRPSTRLWGEFKEPTPVVQQISHEAGPSLTLYPTFKNEDSPLTKPLPQPPFWSFVSVQYSAQCPTQLGSPCSCVFSFADLLQLGIQQAAIPHNSKGPFTLLSMGRVLLMCKHQKKKKYLWSGSLELPAPPLVLAPPIHGTSRELQLSEERDEWYNRSILDRRESPGCLRSPPQFSCGLPNQTNYCLLSKFSVSITGWNSQCKMKLAKQY